MPLRLDRGDGPVQPISWRNFGPLSFSSDGQLLFQSGTYYHEFTGDYPELAIFDLATGSELENVIDHQLSPSADGRHLFGQLGGVPSLFVARMGAFARRRQSVSAARL